MLSAPRRTLTPAVGLLLVCVASIALAACGSSATPATTSSTSIRTAATTGTAPPRTSASKAKLPAPAVPSRAVRPTTSSRHRAGRVQSLFARFTACMRTRGIQLPTPGVKTRKPPKPVNTASPAFKAALAGCRGILQALKPKPAPGHPTP